jgi:hypothetical protein
VFEEAFADFAKIGLGGIHNLPVSS